MSDETPTTDEEYARKVFQHGGSGATNDLLGNNVLVAERMLEYKAKADGLTADLAAATRRAETAEAALSRYVSVGWWSEGNGFTPSGLIAGHPPETASATRFMKRRGDQRVYIIRNALAARTEPGGDR